MSTVIAFPPSRTHRRPVPGQPVLSEPARRRPALRLTRRGRRLARAGGTVLVLLAIAAGVLLLNRSAQAGTQPQNVPLSYHVVLPGETLWKIAGEVAPNTDRRATIDQLMDLNALDSVSVSVGQRIAVPAAGP